MVKICSSPPTLRLAVVCVLNCRMDNFLVVLGLLCRSFVAINKGTNKRETWAPLGDESAPSVAEGNKLCSRTRVWKCIPSNIFQKCLYPKALDHNNAEQIQYFTAVRKRLNIGSAIPTTQPHRPCRTCLLLFLIQAMGGSFVLEQPRSSLVLWRPRMRAFLKSIPKVRF